MSRDHERLSRRYPNLLCLLAESCHDYDETLRRPRLLASAGGVILGEFHISQMLRQFQSPALQSDPYAPWLVLVADSEQNLSAFMDKHQIDPGRVYAHPTLGDARTRAELLAMDGCPSLILEIEMKGII